MVTPIDLLAFGVEVVVLALCALSLAYALVVYCQQVLYRGGVLWLATSLGFVTLGAIIELWGLIVHSDVLAVVAFVIYTGASAAIAVSMWEFARGFIAIDQTDADTDTESGPMGGSSSHREAATTNGVRRCRRMTPPSRPASPLDR